MLNHIVNFFLNNKLVAWILLTIIIGWGILTAPFDFNIKWLPKDSVAVDAIPDIGENQQIIFTEWMGRSPQDMEDQITYPLTSSLLGIPGVKSVRSNSMFGFSSIYIIFEEDVEFYWSRSRISEKLSSLPKNLLPLGVQPKMGPDATGLGQIFWYTLEGQDKDGNSTGGWDLHELRTIQDFQVGYRLLAAPGVAEVASIGGFVKEYQIDVNPEKMKIYDITLAQVMSGVKESNLDIGAQTLEMNNVEYFVRGKGYVESPKDIELSVVKVVNNVPIRIKDIAIVSLGPAGRRGILDKSGAPAVGGVVVARYGANPMEVINNVKTKIEEMAPGLPSKTLADGTESQVKIVPFYDRTTLIKETIGTLEEALTLEILITIIVVILMLLNLKSSLLISSSLPVAVLMCFIAMRYFGVDANIVALSGIAIAVGTMVDMGIVLTESMVTHLKIAPPDQTVKTTIYLATIDVASAVVTAVATTIVSFLPVFTMEASEGKLFRPLAYTKTFALIASIIVAIAIIPPIAESLFRIKKKGNLSAYFTNAALCTLAIILLFTNFAFFGVFGLVVGLTGIAATFLKEYQEGKWDIKFDYLKNILYALVVSWLLAKIWMPLGAERSLSYNFLFVSIITGVLIGVFYIIIHYYESILRFLLEIKILFIGLVTSIVLLGLIAMFTTKDEFLPSLNEGSFLLMPSAMPHAGMEENEGNLRALDMAVSSIPEVETVVGKAGRIESSLDPAPMSMYENIIIYKSEYATNEDGHRIRFKSDDKGRYFVKVSEKGMKPIKGGRSGIILFNSNLQKFEPFKDQSFFDEVMNHSQEIEDMKNSIAVYLIHDNNGKYYRQWRKHIKTTADIWSEIEKASKLPSLTVAPLLQPIQTRLIMLQTGMRAPMGIKIKGPDLETIQKFGIEIENLLRRSEGVKPQAVFADRIVGKPYLIIDINREVISRYGLTVSNVQEQVQAAVGGMIMTTTVEGRERYSMRVRYPKELRNDPSKIEAIYIATPSGTQIQLGDVVDIKYEQGPQSIKSEDGFLVGYVLFDRLTDEEAMDLGKEPRTDVEVVEIARDFLDEKVASGELKIPKGVSYKFAGNYEQQVRSKNRLLIVIPISLILIFLILYFHFSSVTTSLLVFSGVFVAFAGGFIMIWFFGQDWFMNFDFFGMNLREMFQMKTISMSVAVWVGFLALFGIATDDGVLVATFLKDSFKHNKPKSVDAIRNAVVEGGSRRVRPAMMTTATTILALLPIMTSTGRGADIMIPMAIPSFGGMVFNTITMFTVPVLYCLWQEMKFKKELKKSKSSQNG